MIRRRTRGTSNSNLGEWAAAQKDDVSLLILAVLNQLEEADPNRKDFTLADLRQGITDYQGKKVKYMPRTFLKSLNKLEVLGFIDLDHDKEGRLLITIVNTKRNPQLLADTRWSVLPDVTKMNLKDTEEADKLFSVEPRLGQSLGIQPHAWSHYVLWKMRSGAYKKDPFKHPFLGENYREKQLQKLTIMGIVEPKQTDKNYNKSGRPSRNADLNKILGSDDSESEPSNYLYEFRLTKKGEELTDRLNQGKAVRVKRDEFSKEWMERWPEWKPFNPFRNLGNGRD